MTLKQRLAIGRKDLLAKIKAFYNAAQDLSVGNEDLDATIFDLLTLVYGRKPTIRECRKLDKEYKRVA